MISESKYAQELISSFPSQQVNNLIVHTDKSAYYKTSGVLMAEKQVLEIFSDYV